MAKKYIVKSEVELTGRGRDLSTGFSFFTAVPGVECTDMEIVRRYKEYFIEVDTDAKEEVAKPEPKENPINEVVEEKIEEVKEEKPKRGRGRKKKEEPKEEILTDDTSDVEIKIEE